MASAMRRRPWGLYISFFYNITLSTTSVIQSAAPAKLPVYPKAEAARSEESAPPGSGSALAALSHRLRGFSGASGSQRPRSCTTVCLARPAWYRIRDSSGRRRGRFLAARLESPSARRSLLGRLLGMTGVIAM